MPLVPAGHQNTVYVVAIITLALVAYSLWRNYKRRGQTVGGARIAPAVDAALRRLLAGKTRFVVLSVRDPVYLQFATEPNGSLLAEANCPAGNEMAEKVLSGAGLSAVQGRPNYRARLASADVGWLAGLVRSYLEALGAGSLTIQTGR